MEEMPTTMHNTENLETTKPLKKLKGSNEGEYPVTGEIRNNDAGNAKRLTKLCGYDILFVKEPEEWFVWDGKRWVHDVGHVQIRRSASSFCGVQVATG